jgi:hypothetical protein
MKTLERPVLTGMRPRLRELREAEPGYQAYSALVVGYTVLPIVAGADKFTRYLADWSQYLAPAVAGMFIGRVDAFMRAVGVIEIAAGVLVALKPRWGSLVVCLWLLGIVGNLLLIPGYFDVALRDVGLAVGAFSLWRLSGRYDGRAP